MSKSPWLVERIYHWHLLQGRWLSMHYCLFTVPCRSPGQILILNLALFGTSSLIEFVTSIMSSVIGSINLLSLSLPCLSGGPISSTHLPMFPSALFLCPWYLNLLSSHLIPICLMSAVPQTQSHILSCPSCASFKSQQFPNLLSTFLSVLLYQRHMTLAVSLLQYTLITLCVHYACVNLLMRRELLKSPLVTNCVRRPYFLIDDTLSAVHGALYSNANWTDHSSS